MTAAMRRRRGPELDTPLLHLVLAVDDVDIVALLIRQHGRARNRHRLDRFGILEDHRDEFAVDELARRAIRLCIAQRIARRRPAA